LPIILSLSLKRNGSRYSNLNSEIRSPRSETDPKLGRQAWSSSRFGVRDSGLFILELWISEFRSISTPGFAPKHLGSEIAGSFKLPYQVGKFTIIANRVGVLAEITDDLNQALLIGGVLKKLLPHSSQQTLPGQTQK
jgi:hypothetical protein